MKPIPELLYEESHEHFREEWLWEIFYETWQKKNRKELLDIILKLYFRSDDGA